MTMATAAARPRLDLLATDQMHLIVMPTEQCNFRCGYCYEDFAIGAMDEATWMGISALMERRIPELHRFTLSWFGGEPLLAAQRVLEITNFAKDLATKNRVSFSSDITTNAALLRAPLFRDLVEAGVTHYQITLDGPADVHNKYRQTVNGRATFDTIRRNLSHALHSALDFVLVVRVHVREELVQHRDELADLLAELNDKRVRFFFRGISDLGGPHAGEIATMAAERCEAVIRQLQELAASVAPKSLPFDTTEDAVCYAASPSSWVIRADGSLAKCTVALTDPRNAVGRISPDGRLIIDSASTRPWVRGVFSNDADELGCPLKGLPTGPRRLTVLPMPTRKMSTNSKEFTW